MVFIGPLFQGGYHLVFSALHHFSCQAINGPFLFVDLETFVFYGFVETVDSALVVGDSLGHLLKTKSFHHVFVGICSSVLLLCQHFQLKKCLFKVLLLTHHLLHVCLSLFQQEIDIMLQFDHLDLILTVVIDDFDLAAPLGSLVSVSFQLNFQLLQSICHLPSGLGHLKDVLLMLLVHLCVLAKDFFHLTL